MKQHILALLVSLGGILATYHFFRLDDWQSPIRRQKEPLAILTKLSNDVRKKSSNKLTWGPILVNESLFSGDMIRTSNDSLAVIKFIKDGVEMEIEADSTVIVQEDKENLSLNVLEGGLFVTSTQKNQNKSILVKSGKKVFKANNADFSVSVDKKGEVGLEVYRGLAQTGDGNQISDMAGNNVFKDISPSYGRKVYLSRKKPFRISWSKFDHYDVVIDVGTSRRNLDRVQGIRASSKQGSIGLRMDYGQFYWRLKALSKKGGKDYFSKIYKNDFIIKRASVPVYPGNKSTVFVSSLSESVNFEWVNPISMSRVKLEVALDAKFREIFVQKNFEDQRNFSVKNFSREGRYYWRLTSTLADSNERMTSSKKSFVLKIGKDVIPPRPFSPENDEILYLSSKEKSKDLKLSWEKVTDGKGYELVIRKGSKKGKIFYRKKMSDNKFRLRKVPQGVYYWAVSTIGAGDKQSVFSEIRKISVLKDLKIKFIGLKKSYKYFRKKPQIILKWNASMKYISKWKLDVSQQQDFSEVKPYYTKKRRIKFSPMQDGQFFFRITGFDSNNNVLGKSDTYDFIIEKKSFSEILPPKFSSPGKRIIAGKNGAARIELEEVDGASSYQIDIKKFNGDQFRTVEIKSNNGWIRNLAPGKYWIQAKAVAPTGELSELGLSKALIVPKKSSIAAPKIRNIEVK